jgi:hypothetical protein
VKRTTALATGSRVGVKHALLKQDAWISRVEADNGVFWRECEEGPGSLPASTRGQENKQEKERKAERVGLHNT